MTLGVAQPVNPLQQTAKLNKAAGAVRDHLMHVPTAEALGRLARDLTNIGAFPDGLQEDLKALLEHADANHRLIGFLQLIGHSQGQLADLALDIAEKAFEPEAGVIELTAIKLGGGRTSIRFDIGDMAARTKARAFLVEHMGWDNLYIGVQPRRADWSGNKVASAQDVLEHRRLALDFDRFAHETADAWKKRADKIVANCRAANAFLIVMSGNGIQAFWKLTPSQDETEINRRIALIATLSKMVSSDNVGDLPRIMRLPITVNLPTAKKLKRGCEIALAQPIHVEASAPEHGFDEAVANIARAFGVMCPVENDRQKPPDAPRDLTRASKTSRAAGKGIVTGAIDPEDLRATTPDIAIRALQAIPNPPGGPFAGRADWVDIGLAFKGAVGDHPDAEDAFVDWSSQFGGDPAEDRRTYRSFKPDRIGWARLRHLLRAYADPNIVRSIIGAAAFDDAYGETAETVANSGQATQAGKKVSEARAAVQRLLADGMRLIQSPDGRAYARIGNRTYAIKSEAGKRAITGALVSRNVVLNKSQAGDFFHELEARATNAPRENVHVRVAFDEGTGRLYFDLANVVGKLIEVAPGATTYRIINGADGPAFIRPGSMAPLPEPQPTSAAGVTWIDTVSRHLNLPPVKVAGDPTDAGVQARARVILALCSWVVPIGTAAAVFITGPNGSGKTTSARRLTGFLDPTSGDVGRPGTDPRDLFVVARTRLALVLDNLSFLKGDAADTLCALLSGADLSRRALYTDDDAVSLRARSGLVLTSIIEGVIERPDLLDRAVTLALEPPPVRRSEAALAQEWDRDHPAMLHGFLLALAKGLGAREAIEAAWAGRHSIRLLDAATLAEAVARASGWRDDLLIEAIEASRRSMTENMLDNNPIVTRLKSLLTRQNPWSGTMSELVFELGFGVGSRGNEGAKSPEAMRAALNRLKAPLALDGVDLNYSKSTSKQRERIVTISMKAEPSDGPPAVRSEAIENNDVRTVRTVEERLF